jgi:hypothetical protein
MTKNEFERRVTELIKKYRLGRRLKERIVPLFSLVDNLSREEVTSIYNVLEKAIEAPGETGKLSMTLDSLFADYNDAVRSGTGEPGGIENKLKNENKRRSASIFSDGKLPVARNSKGTMKFNKQSFPSEKPNFGLKLNKLFSAFITEYGPHRITLVISDSILYTNNLILRITLKTKEVLIGSSKSIKLYETEDGNSFLVTEKPEVIPFGSTNGFYFKNITYEDILNLTNGDFFKVFSEDILKTYREHQTGLPEELKKVGYYRFE